MSTDPLNHGRSTKSGKSLQTINKLSYVQNLEKMLDEVLNTAKDQKKDFRISRSKLHSVQSERSLEIKSPSSTLMPGMNKDNNNNANLNQVSHYLNSVSYSLTHSFI